MITKINFYNSVQLFFDFLKTENSFHEFKKIANGNAFYDIEFKKGKILISISYENIEDHLEITIFLLQNGEMPKYDDKKKLFI